MIVRLGINTGFALNRFTTPQEWIPFVGETLGVRVVQFTADLLNPSMPDEIIKEQIDCIRDLCQKYNVEIRHTFTSAFTRVNHLSHPDDRLREYWIKWFCSFADISVALGAESMGSHFGILTVRDYQTLHIRKKRFLQTIEGWQKIAKYASKTGLKYLTWEPMSIAREYGETIEEAKRIHQAVNEDIALPMKLCLDVDHGDVSFNNPDDTDPYAWIREFAKDTPLIHLKQSLKDKGGHYPFTDDYNRRGKIVPGKIISTLKDARAEDVTLLLELSFREREPFESRVINDLKASVAYWRPFATI